MMTKTEVCEILVISDNTLRRIIAAGELGAIKVGQRLRFDPKEIERYIARSTQKAVRPVAIPKSNISAGTKPIGNSGYYPGMKVV